MFNSGNGCLTYRCSNQLCSERNGENLRTRVERNCYWFFY